jgi:hypothetical protein
MVEMTPFLRDGWSFGLCTDQYERGLPHTLGYVIMLPTRVFTYTDEAFLNLLLHERIHVLQKMHPDAFKKLYSEWEFKKIDSSIVNPVYLEYARCNPDTPEWWVIRDWIPVVLFREGARELTDVTYEFVRYQENGISVERTEQRNEDWYMNLIGYKSHCYHPDETSAVLLSDYFSAKLNGQRQLGQSPFEIKMYNWLTTLGRTL